MKVHTLFLLLMLTPFVACTTSSRNINQVAQTPVLQPWGIIGAKVSDGQEGILITKIITGSTAEAAGLKLGDSVLRVDDWFVTSSEELLDTIRSRLPGTMLQVEIIRNSSRRVLRVRVGEFPLDEQLWLMASAAQKAWDSLRARQLCDEFVRRFPATNRYAARMERLRSSLLRQTGSETISPY